MRYIVCEKENGTSNQDWWRGMEATKIVGVLVCVCVTNPAGIHNNSITMCGTRAGDDSVTAISILVQCSIWDITIQPQKPRNGIMRIESIRCCAT